MHSFIAFLLVATAISVSGDGDMHHLTEEEFCKMPQNQRDKLWKCFEPKVPKPVLDNWTQCSKKIYSVNTAYEATIKMCADDDGVKHKQMEECCEQSKKDLTDEQTIKIVNDCRKTLSG